MIRSIPSFAWAAVLLLAVAPLMPLRAAPPLSPADAAAGRRYAHLLDAAKAHPEATDWTALRAAYAASPAYDTGAGHSAADMAINTAMRQQDFRTAATQVEIATAQNWMDMRAHVMGTIAYSRLGDAPHAAIHKAVALGMFRAITATGNGAAPASAFKVLATGEEYVLLLFVHAQSQGQALIHQDGHAYDKLSVLHAPDGAHGDMYFNIDTSLARETAIALGQVQPIADGGLPR